MKLLKTNSVMATKYQKNKNKDISVMHNDK